MAKKPSIYAAPAAPAVAAVPQAHTFEVVASPAAPLPVAASSVSPIHARTVLELECGRTTLAAHAAARAPFVVPAQDPQPSEVGEETPPIDTNALAQELGNAKPPDGLIVLTDNAAVPGFNTVGKTFVDDGEPAA